MARRRSSSRRTTTTTTTTARSCAKLSSRQKESMRRDLDRESAEDILEKWSDPTDGNRGKRLALLRKCGDSCFGCPDEEMPMYPVCAENCSPRCAGISAAMGYARRYGATRVIENLREAEEECRRLREKTRGKQQSRRRSRRSASSSGTKRRRRRRTSSKNWGRM